MKTIYTIIISWISLAAQIYGNPQSVDLATDIYQSSSNVVLVSITKIEHKVTSDGIIYLYYPAEQIVFKGDKLPVPTKIIARTSLFKENYEFLPKARYCALLYLKKQSADLFAFSANTVEQQFVEPDITGPLSSFHDIKSVILYLLTSSDQKNRHIGMLFSTGYNSAQIDMALQQIAKFGTAEEKAFAGDVKLNETAKLASMTSEAARPNEDLAKKALLGLLDAWKSAWNTENWDSLVHLSSRLRESWERDISKRNEMILTFVEGRKDREINKIELGKSVSTPIGYKCELTIYYTNGSIQNGYVSEQQDGHSAWSINDIVLKAVSLPEKE